MNIKNQLQKIRKAYDITVENYKKGISDLTLLPEDFKNSVKFKEFQKIQHSCNSNDHDVKKYLNPQAKMRFLDVGSCANLINYKLYEWLSQYYGVDISPKLIKATKQFVEKHNLKIGGLYVAEVAKMPFSDKFFNIATVIGVLEYFDIKYIKKALSELHRVLKPKAKMVIDMPNFHHPYFATMIKLEEYLGRPRYKLPNREVFEKEIKILFLIDKIDDTKLMIKYFVQNK